MTKREPQLWVISEGHRWREDYYCHAPLLLYCIVLLLPCTACLKSRGHHYHTQPFATRVEAHLLRFYSFSFLMVLVDPCDRNYIHWQSSSQSATANINGGACDEVKKLLRVCISQFSPKVAATLKQFQLCGGNMPLLQNCAPCADKNGSCKTHLNSSTKKLYI